MRSYRENPEGEESTKAAKQYDREVFALQMQERHRKLRADGFCPHCEMMASQCQCWDSVNGGD